MSGTYQVEVVKNDQSAYGLLKVMVAQTYWSDYQASISPSPDAFIALKNANNRHLCCFGTTFAKSGPLFSEVYLGKSVESATSEMLGVDITRDKFAECGAFASPLEPGAGRTLLGSLPWILVSLGIHYVLVTVTPQVQKLFERLNIPFDPLCDASDKLLCDEERKKWGNYYASHPITGVIDTRQGVLNAIDVRAGHYAIQTMAVDRTPRFNKVS
jgi:hypothetical protein